MSVWKKVFRLLEENNIDTFPPAMQVGECKSPYVVIKHDGVSPMFGYTTENVFTSVMCYVPHNQYTKLDDYVESIKEILATIHPQVKPTGNETPDFYDDDVKAHMRSIMYQTRRRNQNL